MATIANRNDCIHNLICHAWSASDHVQERYRGTRSLVDGCPGRCPFFEISVNASDNSDNETIYFKIDNPFPMEIDMFNQIHYNPPHAKCFADYNEAYRFCKSNNIEISRIEKVILKNDPE